MEGKIGLTIGIVKKKILLSYSTKILKYLSLKFLYDEVKERKECYPDGSKKKGSLRDEPNANYSKKEKIEGTTLTGINYK